MIRSLFNFQYIYVTSKHGNMVVLSKKHVAVMEVEHITKL